MKRTKHTNRDIITIADIAKEIWQKMSNSDRDVLEDEITFGSPTLLSDLGMILDDLGIRPTENRIRSLKSNLKRIIEQRYTD